MRTLRWGMPCVSLLLFVVVVLVVRAPYQMAYAAAPSDPGMSDRHAQQAFSPAPSLFVPLVVHSSMNSTFTVRPGGDVITIMEPLFGADITSPVHIAGITTLWPFEGTLQAYVKDADGVVLGHGYATVDSGAMEGGPFQGTLTFTPPATSEMGLLEVVEVSPKDGSVVRVAAMPVRLLAGPTN